MGCHGHPKAERGSATGWKITKKRPELAAVEQREVGNEQRGTDTANKTRTTPG